MQEIKIVNNENIIISVVDQYDQSLIEVKGIYKDASALIYNYIKNNEDDLIEEHYSVLIETF